MARFVIVRSVGLCDSISNMNIKKIASAETLQEAQKFMKEDFLVYFNMAYKQEIEDMPFEDVLKKASSSGKGDLLDFDAYLNEICGMYYNWAIIDSLDEDEPQSITVSVSKTRNLVAISGSDTQYKEIYVYVTDNNGADVRDLVVCRPSYHYDDKGNVVTDDMFDILVRNEGDTDYNRPIVLR